MGACLTPTPDMRPWYNVEANTTHAELTATTYLKGWYRIRGEGGATDWREIADGVNYTDEERAAAWITYGPATFASPAAPVAALLATLDQITDHPTYRRWKAEGGRSRPTTVTARQGYDGRLLVTGLGHRHPEDEDGTRLHMVELLYADIAPLREAIQEADDHYAECDYPRESCRCEAINQEEEDYRAEPADMAARENGCF